MVDLRFTLLADGSSDRVLLPILTWLLGQHVRGAIVLGGWADLSSLPQRPKNLAERMMRSVELSPCDLLFVHRDAEREPPDRRTNEIRRAWTVASRRNSLPPGVPVVPVRMQEAWLLFDELALRRAAGNPRDRRPLPLPRPTSIEFIPDPKLTLHELLREASGLSGRRRRTFHVQASAQRVTELISDFSHLRVLPAFQALEEEVRRVVAANQWGGEPT